MRDIIYDEKEVSSATNSIENYISFLVNCIETYVGLLADLQGKAIKDDLICKELSELAIEIITLKKKLNNQGIILCKDIKNELTEIAEKDKFVFPGDFVAELSMMLKNLI